MNLEDLKVIWSDHSIAHESNSIRSALNVIKLSIEKDTIKGIVPSALIKEKVMGEKQLMMKIRQVFNDNVILDISVDLDLFPDYKTIPVKRHLTIEDKYIALVDKNPNLDLLVKKLKLKIDEK